MKSISQATHVTEMSSLKEEVSRKLPQIAEEAAAEAGRQWRSKVEEETAAVRAERDHRLRELQVLPLFFTWKCTGKHDDLHCPSCAHG